MEFEQRKLERFAIPNAWVIYDRQDSYYRFGVLLNISRSSIAFEIEEGALDIGSNIELTLIIPPNEELKIKGTIIRESESLFMELTYAVVQFLPFGSDEKRYNSLDVLERIKELEEDFLHKFKILKIELVENE